MTGVLADFNQLHFLRPLWLLGLLALPLLAWWWREATRTRSPWRDAVDAHLLPHLLDGVDSARRRPWPRWLGLMAAALALVAMAGPSVRKQEHPLWQTRAPLVIALDLSSASLANDMPPSRLAQARGKIGTLLRERAGGQVALVAYAGDAFTVAPLTEDAANVALFLDALQPDIMPEDGQRSDRAIAWSQQLLRQAGFDRGDILLLTDHADAAALAAASRAITAGYRVSALGLGTEQGGVFDVGGSLGQARLDAASLRRLATSGGGTYRSLVPGSADLRALGVLAPQADAGAAARGEKIASWRDDGYWLLPLVLLLALPLFRRGTGAAALLVVALCLPMPQAQAQDTGNLWRRPDQAAHARMQDGVAAYRAKDYASAIATFSGLDSADGQYNLGNALAKAGRYDDAIAAYDRALRRQPKMADAIANRAAVDAARKRQPPPGQQPQQGDKDKGQGQPQPQPGGKSGPARDGSGSPPPRQQPSSPGQRQQPQQSRQPQPKPRDPQQQSAADAAQRQRIEQALRKQQGKPGEPAPVSAKPAETAEQRERRVANQAQLQRVPDDPGGLLRARFRLEFERRQGGGP
ncbi:MAG: VWA domain-containing protein [Pseudomonadota bacterium]